MKARLTLRIDLKLLAKLKKLAEKDNRQLSDFVRIKLEEL